MHNDRLQSSLARRSFLSRLGAGAAAVGAAFGFGESAVGAQAPAPAQALPQPARHTEDDWFDQPAAKHRFFLDTTTVNTFGSALRFVNNYFSASRSAAYGLTDADSAVVICVRHESTPFAFNDAMWAKYGEALAGHAAFTDPKTKQTPTVNVFQAAAGYGTLLTSRGTTVDALIGRGLRIAVCSLATRAIASEAARKTGAKVDDVLKELTDNRIANTHMVPAGIVAVNRAQEHGYSISSVG
jgi:intracellular sulfur oxidation DsrE/DsrF family protein